jgi:circadian clock protein KaiC
MPSKTSGRRRASLPKSPTGVVGLDEITGGGLPTGRPTLVCGAAGSGKTMLAVEFLVRGATQFGEPGVFMMFEENSKELTQNVRSLGFDLDRLVASRKLVLDHVQIERSEIEETGEYDLEGLFIRLGHAVDSIGAKRVVVDTLEALFAGLPNHAILRAELRRLFRWLKDRGLTAIITGERGDNTLTRHGLEEYVADCVILLDHRITEQVSTRRLRVVKYRGTFHGTNEYPFLIGESGLSVLPITSLQLDHQVSKQRISTGIPALDAMLGGRGYYRGSSILASGAAGTGKSSLGATFIDACCRRGERCLVFAYEESPEQYFRNMRSIGIDLRPWLRKGLLEIHASRPTLHGLEQHLLMMHDTVRRFRPRAVVVDPITNLTFDHRETEIKPTLMRLIDFLKQQKITALFTSLTTGQRGQSAEDSQVGVSSLMDTWLLLSNVEQNGERNRMLYILKSRGMPHSNQVREFIISRKGIDLVDVQMGPDSVLVGSARHLQTVRDQQTEAERRRVQRRRLNQIASRRKALEAQIAVLRAEAAAHEEEVTSAIAAENLATEAARNGAAGASRRRNVGARPGRRRSAS